MLGRQNTCDKQPLKNNINDSALLDTFRPGKIARLTAGANATRNTDDKKAIADVDEDEADDPEAVALDASVAADHSHWWGPLTFNNLSHMIKNGALAGTFP